jgi:hypothetical protein
MKKLCSFSAVIFSPLMAGAVMAEDYPGQDTANSLINLCRQEGMAREVDNVDSYYQ